MTSNTHATYALWIQSYRGYYNIFLIQTECGRERESEKMSGFTHIALKPNQYQNCGNDLESHLNIYCIHRPDVCYIFAILRLRLTHNSISTRIYAWLRLCSHVPFRLLCMYWRDGKVKVKRILFVCVCHRVTLGTVWRIIRCMPKFLCTNGLRWLFQTNKINRLVEISIKCRTKWRQNHYTDF